MNDKPRIGVVGTGWWATQYHIPSLLEYDGADLVALADPDPEALRRASDACGVDRTYADPQELYESGAVDGVIIAVPHAYHYEQARAALDAGLHVLLEKPMTLRSEHAYDLVRRAEAADRRLMVGLTYQHTKGVQRLREAIQSGAIGDLLLVSGLYSSMVEEYYRGRPDNYRDVFEFPVTGPSASTYSDPAISGGGQGQTQVTHTIGMILYATGKRAASVNAVMDKRGLAVDVADAMSYTFVDGGIGTMAATGSIRPGQQAQQEFRYYGTDGLIVQDLLQGTVTLHRNDGDVDVFDPAAGPALGAALGSDELYPARVTSRAFTDLIVDPAAPNFSPPGPAADTVAFLEAAYASAEQGGASVAVAQPLGDSSNPM